MKPNAQGDRMGLIQLILSAVRARCSVSTDITSFPAVPRSALVICMPVAAQTNMAAIKAVISSAAMGFLAYEALTQRRSPVKPTPTVVIVAYRGMTIPGVKADDIAVSIGKRPDR